MFEGGISSYICECPAKNPTTDQIQTWHEARPGVLGATETNSLAVNLMPEISIVMVMPT